jgi:hypothetical protein
MSARDAYRLIVTRGGPRLFSGPGRIDRVEVVGLEEGEVVFLWDLPARQASRLARALREDLGAMEPQEFVGAWRSAAEEGRRRG